MQLQSVKETADRFNISERRVQKLCEEGRIEGAHMISSVWVIPDTAEKPSDERYAVEIDDMVSLADLCKELSISLATGRNWVKLHKLVPSSSIKRTPYFTHEYIAKLKTDIKSGSNTALKTRRNKKHISGNNVYNSYVSEKSINVPAVQSVIDMIEQNEIEITDSLILVLLADCAVQLVISKTEKTASQAGIPGFLKGKFKDDPYMFLVSDLLDHDSQSIETSENYPELLNARYVYEEGEDILGLLYISLKNIGSRKATGSYYTPTKVVKKLCHSLLSMNGSAGKTVLDPCCGTGNFILQLPASFDHNNVYGHDIDKISVQIARINYALKYMVHDKHTIYSHISEQDYLSFSNDETFDFIIGNPPWGYHYSENEKKRLRNKYASAAGSNIESYDVFVEQAFHNLKSNGVLAFVLPEAFLNVKAHTPIRKLLLKQTSIQYLEFLGNAFDKVQCPCIILQAVYTGEPFSSVGLTVNDGNRVFAIKNSRKVNADCFSFNMTDEEYQVIEKIENVDHKSTLAGQAIFALGIVTGNNNDYISSRKRIDNEMVLKGSDLLKYRFRDTDNYIVFKPESFQQIAPTEYYRAEEKLLYRFICNQLVFAYDNRKTLSLNSCNILIPQIPKTSAKYVLAILNSRIAQFYFKRQFNSVKVLRSHIEQIPIPVLDEKEQERIIRKVDSLLDATDESFIIEQYDAIDAEVAGIFKLSDSEYQLIRTSMNEANLFLY